MVNEVGQLDEQVPSARAPVLGQEIDARAVPTVAVEGLDIPGVFERIEQMLLGGPRRYTRAQVAAEAGISRAEANELWRALGFATVGDDEVVFTDGDVEALRTAADLTERLGADNELRTAITRLLGRTFAQLASFQGQLLIELVASRPQLLESEDSVIEFVDMVVPLIESMQSFVWRRQMVAYFSRFASHAGPEVQLPGAETVAVGFADMAGFTTLTRRATEAELRQVLEAFEAIATEIVGACGGRIVKTIGDEVLFVADSADAAAEIALATAGGGRGRRAAAGVAHRCRRRTGGQPARRRIRLDGEHRQPAHLDLPPGLGARRSGNGRAAARGRAVRAEASATGVGARLPPSAAVATAQGRRERWTPARWTAHRAESGTQPPVGLAVEMKTFDELFAELTDRRDSRPAGSATVAALDAGVHAQGKKVVEEAAEVWMAAEHESAERTAEEISQLLYRVQVLMLGKGIGLDDVYRHL